MSSSIVHYSVFTVQHHICSVQQEVFVLYEVFYIQHSVFAVQNTMFEGRCSTSGLVPAAIIQCQMLHVVLLQPLEEDRLPTSNLPSSLHPEAPSLGKYGVREELDILRRKEWERRNQEALQDKELYQESVPLFGEPYKKINGDELSSRIQRMLGNYEDGNNLQYDGATRDRPLSSSSLSSSYGHSGLPLHKDKTDPSFQSSSSYGSTKQVHSSHGPPQPSKKFPLPGNSISIQSKEIPVKSLQVKTDSWSDLRNYSTLPAILPDLSPPAEPLSPLHSSESSDFDQDMDEGNDGKRHSLSPQCERSSGRTNSEETQKETSHLSSEAPIPATQTFSLPLSSKPNLANSRKPMALVRPMDGPDQVTSESPDLKPPRSDYHENLSDLKSVGKPNLPPLKIPSQSVEMLSNEVQRVEEILREMTHSWPPLLTAIQTPSTAESSKFSFPNKVISLIYTHTHTHTHTHIYIMNVCLLCRMCCKGVKLILFLQDSSVHREYQQPQKHSETPPKAPPSPAHQRPLVCDNDGTGVLAPPGGAESGSSSDSESSSESESDSESNDSSADETAPAPRSNTPPAKAEGLKDINWQLISWIKESQQSLNPQNHVNVSTKPNPKPTTGTKSQSYPRPEEDSKPKTRKHYTSRTPVSQPEFSDANFEAKPAPVTQHNNHKPASSTNPESGTRKTVGEIHLSKSAKAPSSLHVESVEVTPRNKDATFTERPKVKTKTIQEKKSVNRKSAKRSSSDKKDAKEASHKIAPVIVEDKKEAESSSPPRKNNAIVNNTPSKSSKKSRPHSPTTPAGRKSKSTASRSTVDVPLTLVVKIQLTHLSRVPQIPKATKMGTSILEENPVKKPSQEKEPGKAGKKRPAGHSELSVPKKKPKLQKDKEGKTSSSSQHNSGKIEASKSRHSETDRKSSKKLHTPVPAFAPAFAPASAPAPASASAPLPPAAPQPPGHKRHSGEMEEKSSSASKHKKKSSSRGEHGKTEKKTQKSISSVPNPNPPTSCGASPSLRPLLKFDEKSCSVDHHMKEAKKLKHKADAMVDKMSKALSYLDAAMSFVESGIAMETDPQTPKSAYTMFSDTVDLIRFILKLKNYLDPSAPVSERDFLVLCLRCQALLQMAMFRCKRDSAMKYSRTLTEYFKSSKSVQAPSPCISKNSSPMSPMPSPASSVVSNPSSSSNTVPIPQPIQQMASSYINITALFLSAHETWEQAEELARTRTGLLCDLDKALGHLSLMSSMTSLVRFIRQGLHWLRLDTLNARQGS
ncbi:AF4/FMR2 family member 4 isoform X2 [Silurus asotus]|uniref:AF4/FMR2 family member 4 isoform X2 n=1 Tax=Silurus asotus TaxID=30991 RepID=A0AAD5ABA0_SILAS|nr:AF4/FMR2 family member 4 isoform X2 [Silurus asotus]